MKRARRLDRDIVGLYLFDGPKAFGWSNHLFHYQDVRATRDENQSVVLQNLGVSDHAKHPAQALVVRCFLSPQPHFCLLHFLPIVSIEFHLHRRT